MASGGERMRCSSPDVDEIEMSGGERLQGGASGRTARCAEGEQGNGLFVAGDGRARVRDQDLVWEQHPREFDPYAVERGESGQADRQQDGGDGDTGDEPTQSGHEPAPL